MLDNAAPKFCFVKVPGLIIIDGGAQNKVTPLAMSLYHVYHIK